MAFNETLIAGMVSNLNRIPWLGSKLEAPFKDLLAKQKEKLHRKAGAPVESVSTIFRKISLFMFFLKKKKIQKGRRHFRNYYNPSNKKLCQSKDYIFWGALCKKKFKKNQKM